MTYPDLKARTVAEVDLDLCICTNSQIYRGVAAMGCPVHDMACGKVSNPSGRTKGLSDDPQSAESVAAAVASTPPVAATILPEQDIAAGSPPLHRACQDGGRRAQEAGLLMIATSKELGRFFVVGAVPEREEVIIVSADHGAVTFTFDEARWIVEKLSAALNVAGFGA